MTTNSEFYICQKNSKGEFIPIGSLHLNIDKFVNNKTTGGFVEENPLHILLEKVKPNTYKDDLKSFDNGELIAGYDELELELPTKHYNELTKQVSKK